MRLARHHSAFAAVVLGVLAFFTPSLMASQAAGWTVVVATNAFVSHGDDSNARPIELDAAVEEGDHLSTGKGGTLVLARGEDLVTMAENSRIVIVDPQPSGTTLIDQPYGNVEYHVTKGPLPHFEVHSPLLATIVKGTTFSVSADESGNSVTVSEGRVVAKNRSSGASASVGAGQVGAVSSSGKDVGVGAAPDKGAASANGSSAASNKSAGNSGGRGEGGGRSDNSNAGGNGKGHGGGKSVKKNNGNGHGHGHGGN
jgi:hypothetical protein